MNFRALQQDPLWKELWESEEMRSRVDDLVQRLVTGKWDEETRGFLRGQIYALKTLPTFAENLAVREAKEEEARQEAQQQQTDTRRRLFTLPRIA